MADGYGPTKYHIAYRDRPKSLPESVHLAAETANFPHLDKFVKQGLAEGHAESVTLQDREEVLGSMPVHVAAEKGLTEVVEYLKNKHVDLEAGDKFGVTALHLAAIGNHTGVVKLLLDSRCTASPADSQGDHPIHWAATKGHVEAMKVLLSKGAILDCPNKTGWTPLHRAAYSGRKEAIQFLVKAGAKMDAKNKDGNTPLHLAVMTNQLGAMEMLCQSGAKQDILNDRQKTPGDLCIKEAEQEVLMQYNWNKLTLGADVELKKAQEASEVSGKDTPAPAPLQPERRTPRRPANRDEGFPDALPSPTKDSAKPSAAEEENWTADFMQATSREKLELESSSRNPYASRVTPEGPHGASVRHSNHRPSSSESNQLGSEARARFGASNNTGSFKLGGGFGGGAPLPPIGSHSFRSSQVEAAAAPHTMASERVNGAAAAAAAGSSEEFQDRVRAENRRAAAAGAAAANGHGLSHRVPLAPAADKPAKRPVSGNKKFLNKYNLNHLNLFGPSGK